ncbi:MAG: site-specific integrase, partial [Alcaligenaceae bacterium]|nr:site-specific integrase [Alcaligenaceae bacterium]
TSDVKPSDILPKRRKRNYQRVALNELPQLLRDIDNYIGNEVTVLAIRMMAYTFVRTGELIGARWEEFDLQSRRWNIPADRMKMDRPHIVPLAEQVISILNEMKRYDNGSGFVFPADTYGKGKHMSNNTILYALYRMGYRGRMTGHGFRGIASTALHEQDFNHNHIEAQLAHIEGDGETSGAYNYAEYLPQRTKMMQAWADYLDAIKKENIIPFPAKTA